ncbi:NADH-quinone oxidoreductase subunit C [Armatimonas rosea]|uniref:NADH-quinone oxidoreductase subunit C n=1 Tax=Armatimonas rosea TaxID=685828 RepID=A0A7W9SVP2_ARMRO|nr:NADH-quinone oxidoreductase subunit C [Armatimonas rosea]MBB6053707.1 NADH-quinone oxidoreductase subunit C [Armatimonas rosea]
MVDVDVRLGLSGSDLAIRDRTFKADLARRGESNLTADESPEVKALVDAGYGAEIVASKRFRGQDFITVKKERIVGLLTVLRDHASLEYKLVSDILGVDLLGFETEPRFEVVYSLYSLKTYRRIVVKAQVGEDDPTIDTTSGVWPAAEWPEREIYDMLGITFNHHADLRRILMPDDWVGHPLRKDFPLGGEEVEFSHNVREQGK